MIKEQAEKVECYGLAESGVCSPCYFKAYVLISALLYFHYINGTRKVFLVRVGVFGRGKYLESLNVEVHLLKIKKLEG